jgi:RNA polymerase sigma factor (sigma-70 family)
VIRDVEQSDLLRLFLELYSDFKARLKRRLGSEDLANDVLQETYLRVERMEPSVTINKPAAYLFRMALNIAADRRMQDARWLTGAELDDLMGVSDAQFDPCVIVSAQADIQVLLQALAELPARRRQILLAARMEQVPHLDLSLRFGISTRTVEKELKAALGHCAQRLDRKVTQRFGPGAGKQS